MGAMKSTEFLNEGPVPWSFDQFDKTVLALCGERIGAPFPLNPALARTKLSSLLIS
jgi:hypothetical protein